MGLVVHTAASVTVCVATFNGASYVRQQLVTILEDISPTDEIIVVDDGSSDRTTSIIFEIDDPRILLHRNSTNQGHVRAFERAIALAGGKIVCLADQDDLWPKGRTAKLAEALGDFDVVAGRFAILPLSAAANPSGLRADDSAHPWRNIGGLALGRRDYYGSVMAFRAPLRRYLLPIPRYVEAHDHWLALTGAICGKLGHVEDVVVLRRLHDANLSPRTRRTLIPMLKTRAILLASCGHLLWRRIWLKSPRPDFAPHGGP